tara:strand:- start:67446 stop:69413 length:1968 start_codon:yes stop_codon:yes gene_type:complete
MYAGSHYVVSYLATSVINQTQATIQLKVQSLFGSVSSELVRLQSWVRLGLVDLDQPDELNRLLDATFKQQDQIASVMIANEQGREHMLLRLQNGWQMRRSINQTVDGQYTIWRWSQDSRKAEISAKQLEYDPRMRPWFKGAMSRRKHVLADSPLSDGVALVHWTSPYRFFTTHQPGVTASITSTDPQGNVYVIAIDLALKDISRYTTQMNVGTRGMVMVLAGVDDQLRSNVSVIGLPKDERFSKAAQRDEYLLKAPSELKLQVVNDAAEAFDKREDRSGQPLRFYSGSEAWWGTGLPQQLGDDLHVAVTILVPESDIMGEIQWVQRLVWLLLAAILIGSIYRVMKLARRFSQPIECLVQDMKRVSRGVLDEPCRVKSDVREFMSLAGAHENMRQSLQSLMKLERDMQLARQIQQKTFPSKLPTIKGYQLDAWSKPADETGGDSYDVIGLKTEDGQLKICDDMPEKVLFLLADATGHGIGPALSVTQLRAMLRMSVWSNTLDINTIQHINDQVMRDLPEGRFVTAWLGSLDVNHHNLMSFSAGQAPILHYHAREDSFDTLGADTPPLGVMSPLPIENRNDFSLQQGDMFIILSDGIYEAMNTSLEMFGVERVQQVVRQHSHEGVKAISDAIKQAVGEFAKGCKTKDDQTAVIIRRD